MPSSPFVVPHPQTRAQGLPKPMRQPRAARGTVLAVALLVGCSGKPPQGPRDFALSVRLPELDISSGQIQGDCVVETQAPHRAWGGTAPLSLRAAGPPFAEVSRAPARLHVRDDGVATLLVDDGLLSLRGYTQLSQVRLFPKGPVYDGAVYLAPPASLEPVRRTANMLDLRHRIRGPLRLPGDAPQALQLSCSQLSLSQGDFDPRVSAKLISRVGYAYARSGQQLDFWPTPDAGSGMRLQVFLPEAEWIELTVHEHAGSGATERWRVSYQQGTELVVGWVPRSELETAPQRLGVVSYAAGVRFLVPENAGRQSCKRELAVGVMSRGAATRIGTLRAGATWDFAEPDDAERLQQEPEERRLVPIRLPFAVWLKLEPEHSLVVRASELRRCDEAPD